jgi:hypothetical protein
MNRKIGLWVGSLAKDQLLSEQGVEPIESHLGPNKVSNKVPIRTMSLRRKFEDKSMAEFSPSSSEALGCLILMQMTTKTMKFKQIKPKK